MQPLSSLIRHWVVAHDIATDDATHVDNFLLVRYEDLVDDPAATLDRVQRFLGVQPDLTLTKNAVNPSASDVYATHWPQD